MKVLTSCLSLLALTVIGWGIVSARNEDICHLFRDGLEIRDPDSCSRYITCIDSVSHYTTCPSATPFYDKDSQACVKKLPTGSVCEVSCVNSTEKFVADPKSCYGYYYCQDEQTPLYGVCSNNMHFNETLQRCTYEHKSNCTYADFDYCSIVKNNEMFDDVTACNKYYVCTKGKLTSGTCKSTYFNVKTGKCVQKSNVYCAKHPLPTNVCGKANNPKKNVRVSDDATCRGYFFCAQQEDGKPDPDPVWSHCPQDTFFDSSKQACVDPLQVACSEDRCDGRTSLFVLSGTKGCRNYLRCVNGITLDERSCGNHFFSEKDAMCVTDILTFPACAK